MAKFRVKLDMSSFYNDQRNSAYVLINPNWEYIKCLITHIEKIFQIENIQLLTEDSCFLSPLESIEIIKENEVLKPIYLEIENEKKRKKSNLKKEEVIEIIETQLDDQTADFHATQTFKKKKSKKFAKLISMEKENSTSFEGQQNKNGIVSSSENEYDNLDCPQSSTNTKRKRKRKRKRPTSETIENDCVDVLKVKVSGLENLATESNKIPANRGHIRFDNCENDVIKKCNNNNVVWKNALDLLNTEARLPKRIIIEALNANGIQPLGSENAKTIENIVITSPSHDEIVPIFPENSAIDDVKDGIESKLEYNTQKELAIKVSDILPHVEPLKGEFQYGDLVLFKMMCENGQLTDFICGKFIEIISSEDNMGKLILIDGHAEIRNKVSKCKINAEDEGDTESINIPVNDMLEIGVYKTL